ncbi:unnamed protein product [Allacma fusca]|uniref:Uncharacterized protein n=1 Tax=Allacma fusca TaxID=39272 RepID=A0A8J2KJS9_9HEXA|nr:unnamed protein product [Allacma fusca]
MLKPNLLMLGIRRTRKQTYMKLLHHVRIAATGVRPNPCYSTINDFSPEPINNSLTANPLRARRTPQNLSNRQNSSSKQISLTE